MYLLEAKAHMKLRDGTKWGYRQWWWWSKAGRWMLETLEMDICGGEVGGFTVVGMKKTTHKERQNSTTEMIFKRQHPRSDWLLESESDKKIRAGVKNSPY